MFKIFLIVSITVFIGIQVSSLLDTKVPVKSAQKSVNIGKTILPPEQNASIAGYFTPKNWLLTPADTASMKKEEEEQTDDINATLQIVTQTGSRRICKGKKCITITGIVSNTLILEKDDNTTTLKPGESIFGSIIFKGVQGTTLDFENNNTKERYHLKFFSYVLHTEDNMTKTEKGK